MILDTLLIPAKDEKHTISKLSNVCRRWNSQCQPSLFRRLTLFSADDVHALLHIIRSSAVISTYVTHVVAVVRASFMPWAYLVPLLLPTSLPKLQHVSQILIPDAPPSHRSSISFRAQAFYARFLALTSLDFEGCHFRDFRSLVRILGRIESLKRLQCRHVTWGESSCTHSLLESLRATAFMSLQKACLYAGSDHYELYRIFSRSALAGPRNTLQHWSDDLPGALRSIFPQLSSDTFYTQYDLHDGEPSTIGP